MRDYKYLRNAGKTSVQRRGFPLLRIILALGLLGAGITNRQMIIRKSEELWRVAVKSVWTKGAEADSVPVVENITGPQRKLFRLKNGWWQESWKIRTAEDLDEVCARSSGEERCVVARSLAVDSLGDPAPGTIALIARDTGAPLIMALWNGRDGSRLRVVKMKTDRGDRWIDLTSRCVWMEFCPEHPLEGGAVPIGPDFDFKGREHLYTRDLFVGIGESPIAAILDGRVSRVDSAADGVSVSLNHGGNLRTVTSGLARLAEGIVEGRLVGRGQTLGRLSAKDTAQVTLQILRDGKFIRWAEFHAETHPVSDSAIATFLATTGL